MQNDLETEIAARVSDGARQVSITEFERQLNAIGYSLDRSRDCRCVARYLESGRTYPCITTGAKESDTGRNYANIKARRDDNFRALQSLRSQIFAVTRGAIFEL